MTHRREKGEQNEHDSVIASVEATLTDKGFLVRTNPSSTNRYGVKRKSDTFYPDLYTYEGNTVTGIYEVETKSSVTSDAAEKQWKKYAAGSAKFYLVIPEGKLETAKSLAKKFGISVAEYYTF